MYIYRERETHIDKDHLSVYLSIYMSSISSYIFLSIST